MVAAIECPSSLEWERYVLGDIAGDRAGELDEHLDRCSACLAQLRSCAIRDGMCEALQNPRELTGDEKLACDRILSRLRCFDETLSADHEVTLNEFPFLGPRGEPDEIGRLGDYGVLSMLGAGGMGIVFKARDLQLRRIVALKVIKPKLFSSSAASWFLQEARAAAAVKHDNIVTIHHVHADGPIPIIAMEYLEGESLAARLTREGTIPVRDAIRIARQIADGLHAAHDAGLIHRDIKTANIWLEKSNGRVKILDFGLARAIHDDAQEFKPGVILGTPAFMAPEQARGEEVDARADLFSLGCVLYRMLTGRMPFQGNDTFSVLTSHATEQPEPPCHLRSEIPSALSDLVMRLLSKDAESRVASAADVARELSCSEGDGAISEDATAGHARNAEYTSSAGGQKWLFVAVAVLFVIPLTLFSGTILRIATNKGILHVEIHEPDVVVSVEQNSVKVIDKSTEREFTVNAGEGEVLIFEKNGIGPILTKRFSLNRGGKTTVSVTHEEIARLKQMPPADDPTAKDKTKAFDPVIKPPKTTKPDPEPVKPAPGEALLSAEFRQEKHIYGVVYSAKLRQFIVGGGGNAKNVRYYDPERKAEVAELSVPGSVFAMAMDRAGQVLVVAGDLRVDGKPVLQVIDAETRNTKKTIPITTPSLQTIALSLNGQLIAWNDGQNLDRAKATVKVAEWRRGTIREIGPTTTAVRPLTFSPEGRFLRVNEHPNNNSAYDLLEEKPTAPNSRNHGKCAFSPDGRFLAFQGGGVKDYTRIGSGTSPHMVTPIARLEFPQEEKSTEAPVFSLSSKLIGLGLSNNSIRLYRTRDWKQHAVINVRSYSSYAISADDRYVAVGSSDGIVQIWRINPP